MKSLRATVFLMPMLLVLGCGGGDKDAANDPADTTDTTGGTATGTTTGTTDTSASPAATPESDGAKSAEEAMKTLIAGIEKKDAAAAWEFLPASYQTDINTLVRTFAEKMDPEIWNTVVPLVDKIATLLQTKSDMLLDSQQLRESPAAMFMGPPEQQDAIRKALPKLGDMLALVVSEAGDLEKLKSFDGQAFMKTSGTKFLESVDAISQIAPQTSPGQVNGLKALSSISVSTVSSSTDSAELRIEAQGQPPQTVKFVMVEGKWIPEDMSRDWSTGMANAMAGLDGLPQQLEAAGGIVKAVVPGIQNMLIPMENASNQEEFDQALNNLVAGMEGMSGMFGGGPGGPGGPPFGGGFGSPGGSSGDPDDRPFLSPEEEAKRDGTPTPQTSP